MQIFSIFYVLMAKIYAQNKQIFLNEIIKKNQQQKQQQHPKKTFQITINFNSKSEFCFVLLLLLWLL